MQDVHIDRATALAVRSVSSNEGAQSEAVEACCLGKLLVKLTVCASPFHLKETHSLPSGGHQIQVNAVEVHREHPAEAVPDQGVGQRFEEELFGGRERGSVSWRDYIVANDSTRQAGHPTLTWSETKLLNWRRNVSSRVRSKPCSTTTRSWIRSTISCLTSWHRARPATLTKRGLGASYGHGF